MWFITLQIAPTPQDPGQGSRHFSLIHAKILVHSELMVHSGRQFGGVPMYPARQEHEGLSRIFLHSENGPHGDGTQGFIGVGEYSGLRAVRDFF